LIQRELFGLVVSAGIRLRKMGLAARRLHLTITYYDGLQSRRAVALPIPLNGDLSLFEQFKNMFAVINTRRIRLSSMEIRLKELSYPYGQLDLFSDGEKEEQLMKVLDTIRNKYSSDTVRFGGIPKR
jgi:hypothetical protein